MTAGRARHMVLEQIAQLTELGKLLETLDERISDRDRVIAEKEETIQQMQRAQQALQQRLLAVSKGRPDPAEQSPEANA